VAASFLESSHEGLYDLPGKTFLTKEPSRLKADHEEKEEGVEKDPIVYQGTEKFREYAKDQCPYNRTPECSHTPEDKHAQKSDRDRKREISRTDELHVVGIERSAKSRHGCPNHKGEKFETNR
jgi:hypothetical protein